MSVLKLIFLGQLFVLASLCWRRQKLFFNIEEELTSNLSELEIVDQIKESKKLLRLFEKAKILKEKEDIVKKREADEVNSKTDSKTEPKSMCDSTEKWIKPILKLGGKKISMIVGNDTMADPLIKVNECISPGEECKGDTTLGHPTWCHQEFRPYKLLVHGKETEQQVEEIFMYPSCCVCKLGEVKKKGQK